MNEINLSNTDEIPLPPEEIKVREFTAKAYPDGQRIRLRIKFTPFQKKPSAEISINDEKGNQLSFTHIIETIDTSTEITVHLPGKAAKGNYSASLKAFYLQEISSKRDPEMVEGLEQIPIGEKTAHFEIK